MAKKRANGEGTIFQRASDGLWIGRYYVGNELKTVSAKKQEDCLKKLREKQHQVNTGLYVDPDKMTTGQWLLTWFENYVQPSRKHTTIDLSYSIINNHLIPGLGKIPLQKLRSEHIQMCLNKVQKEKKLSPTTISHIYTRLYTALQQAVVNKLISHNPAIREAVKLPKKAQEEVEVLQPWEYDLLLPLIPDDNYGRAILLMLNTGMRAGEICGLQWADISDDIIHVNHACIRSYEYEGTKRGKTKLVIGTPKTENSHRDIPLTKSMQALISRQQLYVNTQRVKAIKAFEAKKRAKEWEENGLVFCTYSGCPMDERNILTAYHKILQQAGLNKRGLHTLRHTFATRVLAKGMDVRTLSEILGHGNVSITLNLYCHSDLNRKREWMDKLDDAASV